MVPSCSYDVTRCCLHGTYRRRVLSDVTAAAAVAARTRVAMVVLVSGWPNRASQTSSTWKISFFLQLCLEPGGLYALIPWITSLR